MAEEQPIFSKGAVQDVLNTRDAIKDIQKSMLSVNKENKEFNKDFSQMYKSADNFASAQENARKNTRSTNTLIKEGNDLIAKATKLTAKVSNLEKQRQHALGEINKKLKKAESQRNGLTGKQKLSIKLLEEEIKGLEQQSSQLLDSADHAKTLSGNYKTLAAESVNMSKGVYGTLAGLSEMAGLSKTITSGFEDANAAQRERKIIMAEEADLQDRINQAYQDYLSYIKDPALLKKKKAEGVEGFLQGKGNSLSPERMKKFGLDTITEGSSGSKAGEKLSNRKEGLKNAKSALPKGLTTMLKSIGKLVTTFAKGLIVVKAMAAVVEFVQYAFFGIDEEITNMAREMMVSKEAARDMRDDMEKFSMEIGASAAQLGANTETFMKMQMAFIKTTGMSTRLNKDQLQTMSLMTLQLGLSNEEAVQLTQQFQGAGVSNKDGLDSLMKSYDVMKGQGKATMTFKTLMGDITKDAELQRIFMTQGADAAMRQAQNVRRTGLSLGQQRSQAEGILDFEGTMSSQLQLQLFTRKDINLQKAQGLAALGKNVEANREIEKQLAKIPASQRKSKFVMDLVLKILGRSREEHYEILNTQAKQNAAAAEERRIVSILSKETGVYHKAKTASYKTQLEFTDQLKGKEKEAAIKALNDYRNDKQYQEDLNKLRIQGIKEEDLETTALNNKINKFSEHQISEYRKRAGFIDGESSSFGNLLSTSQAFAVAMNDLKVLFADMVNGGTIQKLNDLLVGMANSMTEGGYFQDKITGKGQMDMDSLNKLVADKLADPNVQKVLKDTGMSEKAYTKMMKQANSPNNMGGSMLGNADLSRYTIGNVAMFSISSDEIKKQRQKESEFNQLVSKARTSGGEYGSINESKVDDFILRPGQAPIKFNKGDLLMGGTQLGQGGGKVESLLEQLLEETRAGKIIKMDANIVGKSLHMNKSKMSY